jgi:hypothetical protein
LRFTAAAALFRNHKRDLGFYETSVSKNASAIKTGFQRSQRLNLKLKCRRRKRKSRL